MNEPPVPDLLDNAGRLRRFIIAMIVATTAAVIAYYVADSLASPGDITALAGSRSRAYGFVFYVAGAAGILAGVITLAILNRLASRDEFPRAKLRR